MSSDQVNFCSLINYTKTLVFITLDFEIADEGLWICNSTHFLTYRTVPLTAFPVCLELLKLLLFVIQGLDQVSCRN